METLTQSEPTAPVTEPGTAPATATTTPAAAPPPPAGGGFLSTEPAAASAPPAAARTNFFGDHIQKDGQFQEGWTENLRAAGFERLATKAALAKDEATLLRTLDETIGFVGKRTTGVSYPKPGASDADISAFRHEAGVPDSPEAYELKPSQLPPGVEWDDAAMSGYAEIFHEHHVPKAAAQALLAKHLEQVGAQAGAAGEQLEAKISDFAQQSEATYQKEWGEAYETRLESNKTFVQSRFSPDELSDPAIKAALSHPKIVRLVDEARRSLREGPLPGVGSEILSGSHSPRQQAQEIMRANPGWERQPDLARRVNDLYAMDAAQSARGRRK
jgi:hypothetical protein